MATRNGTTALTAILAGRLELVEAIEVVGWRGAMKLWALEGSDVEGRSRSG
jgi:hypothetical protein